MKNFLTLAIIPLLVGVAVAKDSYTFDSQEDWTAATEKSENLKIEKGELVPQADTASFTTKLQKLSSKRKLKSATVTQSAVWDAWKECPKVAPQGCYGDAPVFLPVAPGNYWMIHRGVYHSTNLKDWTPVKGKRIGGMITSAEYADGKFYIYYDNPNDRDWWVYIDDDLSDDKLGERQLVFKRPSLGSDACIFRDEDGTFHTIYEDWTPLHAGKHSWDSPLAGHADSPDGINGFKHHEFPYPIDERTKATGKTATYPAHNSHYYAEDRERKKETGKPLLTEYEVHEPDQDAYGDYSMVKVGKWYYLVCDYHPSKQKKKKMCIGRWRTDDLSKPFVWCGSIGNNMHPDPTIGFAEGKFYILVQRKGNDYVSDGPWVDGVEVRAGVDTNGNGKINQWTDFQKIKETYAQKKGFARIVETTPATLDLSGLPAATAFQLEFRTKKTADGFQPIIDAVEVK